MAEQSMERPSARTPADKRLILVVKVLLVLIVAGLIKVNQTDNTWPIVTWDMFRNYGANPPNDEVSVYQFVAVDSSGKTYPLWEKDLYVLLPSGDGLEAMHQAMKLKNPDDQKAAYAMILKRIQTVLPNADIERVQFWNLLWHHANRRVTPPFDNTTPDERRLLASFRAADVEGQS